MSTIVDHIRCNRKFSWILAIVIGLFFYYSLLLARLAVRPFIKAMPSEFLYDNLNGDMVFNLAFINLFEIILVGTVVSIVMAFTLIVINSNKAFMNSIIAIFVYLMLSFISMRVQLVNFEFDWTWWIKIFRPLIVSVILFTTVRLMSKR